MVTCSSCGQENPEGFRFCGSCGASLEPISAPRETRKTVTVVFSDVTGSTALGEQLDPESLRRVMGRYFDEMKAVVEAHGGTVEKFIGDAVMAVFGIPIVHEDDALRAVRAAAEMRERLGALNEELERDWGVRIEVRTGVNTGEVVAGDGSGGQRFATGDAVNVAKRFEEAAPPGRDPPRRGDLSPRARRGGGRAARRPRAQGKAGAGERLPIDLARSESGRTGPPPRLADGRARPRENRSRSGV